jgi:hypothetical protein
MKKLYFFLTSTVLTLSLNAQLTQSNNALVAGDNYEMYQVDSLVGPGASGANAVWNFSTVTTHSSIIKSYSTTANTNTGYASAQVAVAASANNTSYFSANSSSMLYWGGNIATGNVTGQLTYTAPAAFAAYPMSLNTSTASTTSGAASVSNPFPASGTFNGNCSSMADGTGTLMLPGPSQTFTDVTRVMITQTLNLNITTPIATTATVTQIDYEYYSPSVKGPLYVITTVTAVTAASTNTQVLAYRNKNAIGVVVPTNTSSIASNTANLQELLVYPNPSSGIIFFAADSKDARSAVIFDVTGKVVEEFAFDNGKATLNVSRYQKGIYLYRVVNSSNKTYKTGRITVTE